MTEKDVQSLVRIPAGVWHCPVYYKECGRGINNFMWYKGISTGRVYPKIGEDGQPVPGQVYYACVIADATACCQQGLEFVLSGNHTFPDDYPEVGEEITVTGTFGTYEEGGYQYCQLTEAEFE